VASQIYPHSWTTSDIGYNRCLSSPAFSPQASAQIDGRYWCGLEADS